MLDYTTEAIVLGKEDRGERDAVYTIFTRSAGKLFARATSARTLTSKLASHLEPGSLALTRLVQPAAGERARIADALMIARARRPVALALLRFAAELIPLAQSDPPLFLFLQQIVEEREAARVSIRELLRLIGLDPSHASCARCGRRPVVYFVPGDILFLCTLCNATRRSRDSARGV
ncbi:MAG: recombination protein O N-terminal domain-containing protein [Candidatus Colwellbacteria bacterium]|nr:recombination protein O N-terminal domain-containing protein [Candidatus Colwellbacteria bacterium]